MSETLDAKYLLKLSNSNPDLSNNKYDNFSNENVSQVNFPKRQQPLKNNAISSSIKNLYEEFHKEYLSDVSQILF